MTRSVGGNGLCMHQLGFELPERTGFGGLWEAIAESTETETGAARRTAGDLEFEPTVVAVCEGPTSVQTRAVLAAFRQECCDREPEVAAA